MSPIYPNIYQTSREAAEFTQERAAELLYTSVESLRAYEGGRRFPPERIVITMVELYNDRPLAYYHLKNSAELAAELLPDITITSLPAAVLRLQKEMNDFIYCRDRLLDITYDGVIAGDERSEFNSILKELDDIYGAIIALKYAKE